jgi:hypothetical protein
VASTTCAAAIMGKQANATRTRENFFIRFTGPPRFCLVAKVSSGRSQYSTLFA